MSCRITGLGALGGQLDVTDRDYRQPAERDGGKEDDDDAESREEADLLYRPPQRAADRRPDLREPERDPERAKRRAKDEPRSCQRGKPGTECRC